MGRKKVVPGDNDVVLASQRNLQGSSVHHVALKFHRAEAKLHPANDGTYHESRQQKMIVKDACTRDLAAIRRQNEQDTYTVAENPEQSKRTKNLVDVEDYNSLKEQLADQKKTNSFLHSSKNLWKAECEGMEKNYRLNQLIQSATVFPQQGRPRILHLPPKLLNRQTFLETAEKLATENFFEMHFGRLRFP